MFYKISVLRSTKTDTLRFRTLGKIVKLMNDRDIKSVVAVPMLPWFNIYGITRLDKDPSTSVFWKINAR